MNTAIKDKIQMAFKMEDIVWRDDDNIASIVVDGHTIYDLIRICLDHKLQQDCVIEIWECSDSELKDRFFLYIIGSDVENKFFVSYQYPCDDSYNRNYYAPHTADTISEFPDRVKNNIATRIEFWGLDNEYYKFIRPGIIHPKLKFVETDIRMCRNVHFFMFPLNDSNDSLSIKYCIRDTKRNNQQYFLEYKTDTENFCLNFNRQQIMFSCIYNELRELQYSYNSKLYKHFADMIVAIQSAL